MNIKKNLEEIEIQLQAAAARAGILRSEIKLLAVTKTHSVREIDQALIAGVKYIGENKVQEATDKLPLLQQEYQEFHFIGHLQTNKINKLLQLKPTLIHSVDNKKLTRELSNRALRQGYAQDVLLQVNTSGEESKFGISPENASELAGFMREQNGLQLKGLMTIGRFTQDEKELRRSFSLLRKLRDDLASEYADLHLDWLSMGMSNDYEIAILEGANLVRLGTVLFGPRHYV